MLSSSFFDNSLLLASLAISFCSRPSKLPLTSLDKHLCTKKKQFSSNTEVYSTIPKDYYFIHTRYRVWQSRHALYAYILYFWWYNCYVYNRIGAYHLRGVFNLLWMLNYVNGWVVAREKCLRSYLWIREVKFLLIRLLSSCTYPHVRIPVPNSSVSIVLMLFVTHLGCICMYK